VTGAQADVAEAVAALRLRQERGVGTHESGLTSGTTLVAAPDFAPSYTAPLGSGAVTLNALLVLAEVNKRSPPQDIRMCGWRWWCECARVLTTLRLGGATRTAPFGAGGVQLRRQPGGAARCGQPLPPAHLERG
jgi:hypothetical protein